MAKDIENLNKYEIELNKQLSNIMEIEKKKFSYFLSVFSDDIPSDKSSAEYLKILKKEQMKFRRSSLSMKEVFSMLDLVDYEIVFTLNNTPVKLEHYITVIDGSSYRIRFTDFMIMCEMFNIKLNWHKKAIEGTKSKKQK